MRADGWTSRERWIAREMYANGCTFTQIGDRLGKSKSAVKQYFYTHPEMYGAETPEAAESKPKRTVKAQLCVFCARASGGYGCPWADRLEPVPGWTAESVEPPESAMTGGAWYYITGCPLYAPDKERKNLGEPKRSDRA